MKNKIVFYSHDGRSFGHISIMGQLAKGLMQSNDHLAIYGMSSSRYPHLFLPEGMDYLKLPSYVSVDQDGETVNKPIIDIDKNTFKCLRRKVANSFLEEFSPDYLVIDGHPFGKYDELLESLKRRDSKRVGWLLRMAPDYPENVETALRSKVDDISEYVDDILLIGDVELYDPIQNFPVFKKVADKIRPLGFLCPDASKLQAYDYKKPTIFVQIGGGGCAESLLTNIVESCKIVAAKFGIDADIITGNYIQQDTYEDLQRANKSSSIAISRFTPEVVSKLLGCTAFIGSAGYGTLCEIIATEANALVIPRQFDRGEQVLHAKALFDAGWINGVGNMHDDKDTLVNRIKRLITSRPKQKIPVNSSGVSSFVKQIREFI